MPISEGEADELCRGRIVYLSEVIDSTGQRRAGPHFAIVWDEPETIAENNGYMRVVILSSNDTIDPTYLVPVPVESGLRGNVVCSWRPRIHENQIDHIHNSSLPPLSVPALAPIAAMIKKHLIETRKS
jgi:hypothetical protein